MSQYYKHHINKKLYKCAHEERGVYCDDPANCRSRQSRQNTNKRPQKWKMCQYIKYVGGCRDGINCLFSHTEEERSKYLVQQPCRQWIYNGTCQYGQGKCRYLHPENWEDIRREMGTHKCDQIKDATSVCKFLPLCVYNHDPNYIDPNPPNVENVPSSEQPKEQSTEQAQCSEQVQSSEQVQCSEEDSIVKDLIKDLVDAVDKKLDLINKITEDDPYKSWADMVEEEEIQALQKEIEQPTLKYDIVL